MIPMPLSLTVRMISRRLSISDAEKEDGRLIEDDHPALEDEAFCHLHRLLLAAAKLPHDRLGTQRAFQVLQNLHGLASSSRLCSENMPVSISAPVKMFSTMLRLSKTMCSW